MLEYEWGLGPNPPPLMISSDDPDPTQDPALTHPIVDHHYPTPHHHHHHHSSFPNNTAHFLSSIPTNTNTFSSSSPFAFTAAPHQHHAANSLYDPRAFGGGASMYQAPPGSPPNFSLDCFPGGMSGGGTGFVVVPKSEDAGRSSSSSMADFTARLGLNLGGRTYFSSAEDDFVSRLYRRSRPVDASSASAPRCQAEGCNADLSHAKHYHRRHKVCEFHSKAAAVIAAGLTQRFCQQCSRFHLLSEFDNGKRSCRKRLADHNRRRRKSHHQSSQENAIKSQQEGARNSSSENPARSPQDSATQSTSSVTVALSPPRMLLDCFRQSQPYQATSSSASSSSCSLFFSSG